MLAYKYGSDKKAVIKGLLEKGNFTPQLYIPMQQENRHFQEFLIWEQQGNVAISAETKVPNPEWEKVVISLSLGGSHQELFLKARATTAPSLDVSTLTSGLISGNLQNVRASLESLINSMPQDNRFSAIEIENLNQLFVESHVPLKVEIIGESDQVEVISVE